MDKAVILAAGLGTRMRKADEGSRDLTAEQATAAASGVKALIPIQAESGAARPFLDYVLSELADSGYRRVCLVIGPDHHRIRDYYCGPGAPRRMTIEFAVQGIPRGTADALLAAEHFAAGDDFLMINSDNFYPRQALLGLGGLAGPGVAVFHRDAMVARSNIAADRIAKFSIVEIDPSGMMTQIHEKPDQTTLARFGDDVYVGMNCWRFGPSIFRAAAVIVPSPRGEFEVTDAAQYCIDELRQPLTALRFHLPVLDLSSRSDIHQVAGRLAGLKIDY